jgi:methylase of polypeptide subunit release factors
LTPLSEQELEPLREKVRRRAEGEPYNIFWGTGSFSVADSRSIARLYPAVEAELFETVLKKIEIGDPKATWLLDVGTGNSVLATLFALDNQN